MRSTSVERGLHREREDNDVPRLYNAPEMTPTQISDHVDVVMMMMMMLMTTMKIELSLKPLLIIKWIQLTLTVSSLPP